MRGSEEADRTVDIILLAYNRLDYLQEMVDGLERHTRWPHRITIVDNVSGSQTRQWLRQNRERFHQIIWNHRNEHLAGLQRGIAATESELYVISDADLVPHPPTAEGCWLTRLVALADRHPDFGLIGARLDTSAEEGRKWDPARRMAEREDAPVVDGEMLEVAGTGVWLDLVRRSALRVPYLGGGIAVYALRRAGYRVGIAANVYCTHLGEHDAMRHPEYLARKQSSRGWGIVYPTYPELRRTARPPLLRELALAAPVLVAMNKHGIAADTVVELSRERWPPLSVVEPRVETAAKGRGVSMALWSYDGTRPPLNVGGAEAVAVLCREKHDEQLFQDALACAREWVLLLTPETVPPEPRGWSTIDETAGPDSVMEHLAEIGSRRRWRRALGFSTSEHRDNWQTCLGAAAFGDNTRLRMYVLRRDQPRAPAHARWREADGTGPTKLRRPSRPKWRIPASRGGHIAAFMTRGVRLLRAEWYLLRSRGKPTA